MSRKSNRNLNGLGGRFAVSLFATSALAGPAFAMCTVTSGTGTVANPDPGDVITCTGAVSSDAIITPNAITLQIDSTLHNGNVAVGVGSDVTIAAGATLNPGGGFFLVASDSQVTIDGDLPGVNALRLQGSLGNTLVVSDTGSVGRVFIASGAANTLSIAGDVVGSSGGTGISVGGSSSVETVSLSGNATVSAGTAAALAGGNDIFEIIGGGVTLVGDVLGEGGIDTFRIVDLDTFQTFTDISSFEILEVVASNGLLGSFANFTNTSFDDLEVDTSNGAVARIRVTSGSTLAGIRDGITVRGDGTLQLDDEMGAATISALDTSTVLFDLSGTAIDVGAAISGDTGAIVRVEDADLTLSGDNTGFDGTIELATDDLTGDLDALNVGEIEFLGTGQTVTIDEGGTGDFTADLTGSGALDITGGGTVTISGSKAHAGGTNVLAGMVIGANTVFGSGAINVASGAQAQISASGQVLNPVTGAGTVAYDATGGARLRGVHTVDTITHTAGTLIAEDGLIQATTLDIRSGAEISIDLLDVNGASTLGSDLIGGGTLATGFGGRTLTLTGDNSGFLGTLDVQNAGEIAGDLAALSVANVTGLGTLRLIGSDTGAWSTDISGAVFAMDGTGVIDFTGELDSTGAAGPAQINSGTLLVNTADFVTDIEVTSGARLGGGGIITGNVTNSGTVAPGNSIGVLTIDGDYAHESGSVLEIEFDSSGNIDVLDISGSATLNGGDLVFAPVAGASASGGTFLVADGGVTGTFSSISVSSGNAVVVDYTATAASIGAPVVSPPPPPPPPTPTPTSPSPAPTPPPPTGGPGGGGGVILAVSPDFVSSAVSAGEEFVFDFTEAIQSGTGRVNGGASETGEAWVSLVGGQGQRLAGTRINKFSFDQTGFLGGAQRAVSPDVTLGATLGYASGDVEMRSIGVSHEIDTWFASGYARTTISGIDTMGGLAYADQSIATRRSAVFNGTETSIISDADTSYFGAFGQATTTLTPDGPNARHGLDLVATADVWRASRDAVQETGTTPLSLSVDDLDTTAARADARLVAWSSHNLPTVGVVRPNAELGARVTAALDERDVEARFNQGAGSGVTLSGDGTEYVQGLAGLGADLALTNGGLLFVDYDLAFSEDETDHSFRAGFRMTF